MSRIADTFRRLYQHKRKALIPYITAGDQNPEETVPFMHALVDAGADIVELGVPFSDPMADGPTIQRAHERALRHDTSLTKVIDMVATFRNKDQHTPVVLMGYQNPVEVMGLCQFAERAAHAGIDGLLTVDLPIEEADEALPILREWEIDPIFLLSPTTPEARIQQICTCTHGFVYYVSLKGVTGAAHFDINNVTDKLKLIKKHTELPIAVGFGVKNAQTAAQVASVADAVVVGSALVKIVGELDINFSARCKKMTELIIEMRHAM